MTSSKEDHIRDIAENKYTDWLEQASDYCLQQYFKDMLRESLIKYIKEEYGNDGGGDCNYTD